MGESYGRKIMHGVMKTKRINVGETKISKSLGEINPEDQTKRQNVAKYFGNKIHYDQNEKLEMLGVLHVCARDGFSGKIVGHATVARKNHLVIYEEIYRLMITFFIYKDDVFQISQIF